MSEDSSSAAAAIGAVAALRRYNYSYRRSFADFNFGVVLNFVTHTAYHVRGI